MRRATARAPPYLDTLVNFYPRSPCGERRCRLGLGLVCRPISIHALLAESDGCRCPPRHWHGGFLSTLSLRRATCRLGLGLVCRPISIHALLAESDQKGQANNKDSHLFLSTLSLRRATQLPTPEPPRVIHFYPRSPCGERLCCRRCNGQSISDFYPRSPCGERPWAVFLSCNYPLISIHALLAESDTVMNNIIFMPREFLSTLSLRRATWVWMGGLNCNGYFYPRSPCGERPIIQKITVLTVAFLSTLSLRRATSAPRITPAASRNFYPRSPCGERPAIDK